MDGSERLAARGEETAVAGLARNRVVLAVGTVGTAVLCLGALGLPSATA